MGNLRRVRLCPPTDLLLASPRELKLMGFLAPLSSHTQTQLTQSVTTPGLRPTAPSHPLVLARGSFTLGDLPGFSQTCKSCALLSCVVLSLTRKAEVKSKQRLTATPAATTLPALPSRRQRNCTACFSRSRPRIRSPNRSPPRGPTSHHLNLSPLRLDLIPLPGQARVEKRDATHALSSRFR